jgi:hypothetical protein
MNDWVMNRVAMTSRYITEAEICCGVTQTISEWYDPDLGFGGEYRYKPNKMEWLTRMMMRVPN